MNHLMHTYARLPVRFVRGNGAWLFDDQGQRYLDAIAGIGVCGLGHAHPEIADTIADQAKTLLHTSNLVEIPWQETLGERLCEISGLEKVFVANSGAEAIECAFKLTRLVGHLHGIDRPAILVAEHSFHGRTLACISASGSRKVQAGFEPLVGGFVRMPYGDADAARRLVESDPNIAAILVETIQGEGGIRPPPPSYLPALRRLCDERNLLLILDEVQSGMCRTGRWFAYQHDGVIPDIVAVAKALGNGFPVSACLARGTAAAAFTPGSHGTTFGGNPLACRTACKVIEIMERDTIAERVERLGNELLVALQDELHDLSIVREVRGRGLMIGIELDRPATPARDHALANGLLINVTRDNIIRLLPPLIIDETQTAMIADGVSAAIRAMA